MSPSSIRRLCETVADPTLSEPEKWVPQDAFKFMQEFRRNYNGELTDTLIEKMLFELNRIWSRRENSRINRIKNQYSAEIQRLQRKISHHPNYKEVQSKQTITRLRNELKGSYKENRQAFAERMEKYRPFILLYSNTIIRNPPGIHYVGETVRMANQASRSKKTLQDENKQLREKLSTQQNSTQFHEDQDHRLQKEFDRFRTKLEALLNEFAKKKKEILTLYDGNPDASLLLRKEDWFLVYI